MRISTTRFGEIDVADNEIYTFPDGLIGFEEAKRYVIWGRTAKGPAWWLQSAERPELAFILSDPRHCLHDYVPSVPCEEVESLEIAPPTEAELHVILMVGRDTGQVTANLLAPIVLNTRRRLGKQIVLHHGGYSVEQPVLQPMTTTRKGGRGDAHS